MNRTIPITLIALLLQASTVSSAVEAADSSDVGKLPQYLQVSVDRVVVDTTGLMQASNNLAESIDRLAASIDGLSSDSAAMSEGDKALLMSAVQSVDAAGNALRELAQQLPRTAQDFGERLPQAIRDSGQPIAELSSGLRSARDSVQLITESLPQATENAKSLADSVLDSVLLRLSIYSGVLIGLLALAVIAVMGFVYRQYLGPLARKLDEISGAPGQFAAIAKHMENTSDNLLQLERQAAQRRSPGAGA